jgi:CRP/FNR family cyclic AMP-dependent transcriptional regulator
VRESVAESLARNDLFHSLPIETLEAISKRCKTGRFLSGENIVMHQDGSTDVFFILSGTVRVLLYSPSGKEISFRDMRSGEFFGELAAIDGQSRSANVVALEDTSIASLSTEAFWDILRSNVDVSSNLIVRLAKLIRFYSMRLYEFGTLGVEHRIHAELLRLSQDHMVDDNTAIITPVPTHAVIASRISTRREAVARELSALTKSGLLVRKTKSLMISDIRKLKAMVEEVRGE